MHKNPPKDLECLVCVCDIDEKNYCEFQTHENNEFESSPICLDCLTYMINNEWSKFMKLLDKADCRAAVLRLCQTCPLNLREIVGMPCKEHGNDCPTNQEIGKLWIHSTQQEIIPVLIGAKQGQEREDFIKHLKQMADHFEQEKKSQNH